MSEDVFETPSSTPNFQTELAEQLAELVPEAVADGKIDVAKLQELLADDVADGSERFGLFWPGKRRAQRIAQLPSSATLVPDVDASVDWDTTKNVFIEGDNLEVLKLLQKHYHSKVKLIYIDPPYNTGKDFVYPDNFKEGLENYLAWSKQVNEEGERVSTNSETDGRYHSNWLNMMHPRLRLARNLLTDDGLICISIDDSEVATLRLICDEIFGSDNHLAQVIWERAYAPVNLKRHFSENHEYILVYAKSKQALTSFNLARGDDADDRYKNPDNDPRGPWKSENFTVGPAVTKNVYEILTPSGRKVSPTSGRSWVYSEERYLELAADNRVWFGADGNNVPSSKRFLSEVKQGITPMTIWKYKDVGHSQDATKELKALFDGQSLFSYPKPVKLIKQLLELNTKDEDLVIDFFAGSATTGHAVMAKNSEDGGGRRFILVQLPEPTGENSEARAAGLKSISDIARSRLKRAAVVIETDLAQSLLGANSKFDGGFRSYRLVDSGFSKWRAKSDTDMTTLEAHLFSLKGSAMDDAKPENLLSEILLKQGYSLSEKTSSIHLDGLEFLSVGDGLVLAYVNEHSKPSIEALREAIQKAPSKLIILEDAFQADDELKANLVQLCKSSRVELWTV
jgi:adenine-specific DNA-methyltransferase